MFVASPLRGSTHCEQLDLESQNSSVELIKVLAGDVGAFGGNKVLGYGTGRGFADERKAFNAWHILLKG